MYTEVPVTPFLLAQLWARLWDRGVDELGRLGYSVHDGFYLFMQHAKNAASSGILCCDGKPILVGGMVDSGAEHFTFMQATNEFESHTRPIIRCLRNRVNSYTGEPLYIYSVCVHPSTPRFFQAIGFIEDDWRERTPSGHPLYRFKRR